MEEHASKAMANMYLAFQVSPDFKDGFGLEISLVLLKILQARLQQYMNFELPDVQAGFRKGRGTRDKIANIHWSSKKQESSKNHGRPPGSQAPPRALGSREPQVLVPLPSRRDVGKTSL